LGFFKKSPGDSNVQQNLRMLLNSAPLNMNHCIPPSNLNTFSTFPSLNVSTQDGKVSYSLSFGSFFAYTIRKDFLSLKIYKTDSGYIELICEKGRGKSHWGGGGDWEHPLLFNSHHVQRISRPYFQAE
jgi:hypothetical protein